MIETAPRRVSDLQNARADSNAVRMIPHAIAPTIAALPAKEADTMAGPCPIAPIRRDLGTRRSVNFTAGPETAVKRRVSTSSHASKALSGFPAMSARVMAMMETFSGAAITGTSREGRIRHTSVVISGPW